MVEHVAIIYWFLELPGHHVTRKFKILLSFVHIVTLVLSHNYFLKFVIVICNYNFLCNVIVIPSIMHIRGQAQQLKRKKLDEIAKEKDLKD